MKKHLHLASKIFAFPYCARLTLQVQETKIADFANGIDLDEVARNEPPHLVIQDLPSCF